MLPQPLAAAAGLARSPKAIFACFDFFAKAHRRTRVRLKSQPELTRVSSKPREACLMHPTGLCARYALRTPTGAAREYSLAFQLRGTTRRSLVELTREFSPARECHNKTPS